MRFFISSTAAVLAVAAALACAKATAATASVQTTATLPVQRLPASTPNPAAPADEGRGWISVMGGLASRGDASLTVKGFGGYVGGNDLLLGVRARYYEGFQSLRHGRELGLMVGQRFGPSHSFWAALGAARYEYEHRDSAGNASDLKQGASLPVELVWAPRSQYFGIELRAEANFSQNLPIYTLGVAAALGKP